MTGVEQIVAAVVVFAIGFLLLLKRFFDRRKARMLVAMRAQHAKLHALVLDLAGQAQDLGEQLKFEQAQAARSMAEASDTLHQELVSLSVVVDQIGELVREKRTSRTQELLLRSTEQATKLLQRLRETKQASRAITMRKDDKPGA